jgi:hypothetical protein
LATAFLLAKGGSWPIPFLPSVAGARLRPCPPHPCSSKNPALVFFSFLDGVKVALLSSFLRRVRWSLSPFVFLHSCVKDRGMQGPRPSLDLFLFSLFLCLFFFQRVVVASLLRDKGMFMSTRLLLLILLLHLCQEWEGSHPPAKIKRERTRERFGQPLSLPQAMRGGLPCILFLLRPLLVLPLRLLLFLLPLLWKTGGCHLSVKQNGRDSPLPRRRPRA